MKTSIIITGSGISSKSELLNAIPSYRSQVKELPHNDFKIEFGTKKEAVNALSVAYQSLISDPETKDSTDYSRGDYLSYDAGKAYIAE